MSLHQLERELRDRDWLEADRSTASLLVKLDTHGAAELDFQHLKAVDQLWLEHSQNHFGLSVQRDIYVLYQGDLSWNELSYENMCKRVGWLGKDGKWRSWSNLIFNVNAPRGHLPGRGEWLMQGIAFQYL